VNRIPDTSKYTFEELSKGAEVKDKNVLKAIESFTDKGKKHKVLKYLLFVI
jgi:hypothetical protein